MWAAALLGDAMAFAWVSLLTLTMWQVRLGIRVSGTRNGSGDTLTARRLSCENRIAETQSKKNYSIRPEVVLPDHYVKGG